MAVFRLVDACERQVKTVKGFVHVSSNPLFLKSLLSLIYTAAICINLYMHSL